MNWTYLKTTSKPIYLYGMGDGADRCINELEKHSIPIKGIFASDSFVRGQNFHGFQVITYAQAKKQDSAMIVLVCFGSSLPEVINNIEFIASEQELYVPDFPVVPGPLFTQEFYSDHEEELSYVRSILADKQSVHVFDSIIQYKLTGSLRTLRSCETNEDESYISILQLKENESLVDLGAYRGDTIKTFIKYCPNYQNITAFEPDSYTFRKLLKNTESIPNVTCINSAASNYCGTVRFSSRGGRNSTKSSNGTEIPCNSVDNVLKHQNVTFMNIDVEGMEKEALDGSEYIIRTNKPKILIATYHRNEDLYSIPLQIMKYNPSYKLYMRHFPQIPAWDVNYYFI